MLTCPMCKKSVSEPARQCPRCAADLSLLVDYVTHLTGGLERAQALTRQGELGDAVWAYLAVLEVDPENAVARRQVSRVATAVRQFDRAAPGRRWLERLRRQERFRRWLDAWQERTAATSWLALGGVLLLLLAALAGGYLLGYEAGQRHEGRPAGAASSAP